MLSVDSFNTLDQFSNNGKQYNFFNLSKLEDADITKIVTELQTMLLNRDAATQAFAKIGQQSLFDYLR